jgi:hypothetical protein
MAQYGRERDLIDQVRRLQAQVRRLETKSKQITTHTKTFLVGGTVTTGLQVPPFIVSMTPRFQPDDTDPSVRYPQDIRIVTGISGKLLDGHCWLDFYVNDTMIFHNLPITAARRAYWEGVYQPLVDGDLLSVTVFSADELARDLSAAFMMTLETYA